MLQPSPLTIFHSRSALQQWLHCTRSGHRLRQSRRCCIPAQHRRAAMTRSTALPPCLLRASSRQNKICASAFPPLTIFRLLYALQLWQHCTHMRHRQRQSRRGCIPPQHRRAATTRSRGNSSSTWVVKLLMLLICSGKYRCVRGRCLHDAAFAQTKSTEGDGSALLDQERIYYNNFISYYI